MERQYCGLCLCDQPADARYGFRVVKPRHDPAIAFDVSFQLSALVAHSKAPVLQR